MSFQDFTENPRSGRLSASYSASGNRRARPQQEGFGSAGPLRIGSVRVGGINGGTSTPTNALKQGVAEQGHGVGSGGPLDGSKIGDDLVVYSQNVTMLHRMVQQLGSAKDNSELRGQCRCQIDVVYELGSKIHAELRQQQQAAEQASRQDAARLGAMHAKLTKDYNRMKAIAAELTNQAERRMREVDAQRQAQEAIDREQAQQAFGGSGAGYGRLEHGVSIGQQQRRQQQIQMEEEAINTAIIQETEEELQNINTSLYKVNEIYRDLANIVDQQQEAVDHIETNTEGAHARAQEGLSQVQKANNYQPSCTIS